MAELRDLFGTADPEEYRKKLALSLANSGLDASPIRSGWQGAARLAQALVAGSMMNDMSGNKTQDRLDQANAERIASGLQPIQNFNGAPAAPGGSIMDMLGSKVFGGNSPQPQPPPQAQPSGMPDMGPPPVYSSADTNAPRGFRNNNPGNIEASPWTQKQPGFSGVEPKGRFARFDTMENGVNAMGNLIGNYGQQGINTVQGIINRWAPANDGNNTAAYAATVAKAAGIDPNAPIDMNDPALRNRIITAMAQYENGRSLPQGAALTQGGPVGVLGGQPQGLPQPMPQMAQAAPQGQQGGPSRMLPQIPPEVAARIDALTRQGTQAGLQQAQLLRQPYLAPRETYSVLRDAQGNPIGQQSSLTQEVKAYPQAERWNPVVQNGRTVGYQNAVTGQPMGNPMAADYDILKNPDGTVSFLDKKDPSAGIKTAPGKVPIETFSATTSPGGIPSQKSDISGKVSSVPMEAEVFRKISDIDSNPAKYGFTSGNDPEAIAAKRQIASGIQSSVTVNNAANPILEGVAKQIVDQRKQANVAVNTIPMIHDARTALDNGAVTGIAAPLQVTLQKVGALFGIPADQASNSEVFRATIGNAVLGHIKELGANPSNADRDFIERVQGGQIALEESSLRRILDINEKYARQTIKNFNRDADKLIKTTPDAYRSIAPLMSVDEPPEYQTPLNYPRRGDQGPYGQPQPSFNDRFGGPAPQAPQPSQPASPFTRQQIEDELRRRGRL